MSSLTAAERETVMVIADDMKSWIINSAQRPVITKLLSNPQFEETSRVEHAGRVVHIAGTLPAGGITIRSKAAGTITRAKSNRKGMVAPKCTHVKDDGQKCQMIAKKGTDKCRWHS